VVVDVTQDCMRNWRIGVVVFPHRPPTIPGFRSRKRDGLEVCHRGKMSRPAVLVIKRSAIVNSEKRSRRRSFLPGLTRDRRKAFYHILSENCIRFFLPVRATIPLYWRRAVFSPVP